MQPLPNYLKRQRKVRELSQAEVARILGTSKTTVGRIERGLREPSLEQALRFAALYEVEVTELFAGRFRLAKRYVRRRLPVMIALFKRQARPSRSISRKLQMLVDFAARHGSK